MLPQVMLNATIKVVRPYQSIKIYGSSYSSSNTRSVIIISSFGKTRRDQLGVVDSVVVVNLVFPPVVAIAVEPSSAHVIV
jgi:hypothetical protein